MRSASLYKMKIKNIGRTKEIEKVMLKLMNAFEGGGWER